MKIFQLISLQKIKELTEYIKNSNEEICKEYEDNDYNGK